MLPLPTNTPSGLAKLLATTNVMTALASENRRDVWEAAALHLPDLKIITVPDLTYFLHQQPVQQYPYRRTVQEGLDDRIFIIQTSGKPCAVTKLLTSRL